MTTSNSIIGEFSLKERPPRKLVLKEKIFNDFFKAFVTQPKSKETEEESKNSNINNRSNSENLKNTLQSTCQENLNMINGQINTFDKFYQTNENNYWSSNLEKNSKSGTLLLSKNVSLNFFNI